eukprot:COSAG05_NODE_16851_length_337_cov_0.865546_1_plen_67_part_10
MLIVIWLVIRYSDFLKMLFDAITDNPFDRRDDTVWSQAALPEEEDKQRNLKAVAAVPQHVKDGQITK